MVLALVSAGVFTNGF